MKSWAYERALEEMVGKRFRRYVERAARISRADSRRNWYEEGFKDGWDQACVELAREMNSEQKP